MKKYKSTKPQFLEMANVSTKISGLWDGYIHISNEDRHTLFPHIHFVRNLKKMRTEFIKLSINSDIDKIETIDKKMTIKKNELDRIKKFISINATLLKKYYMQGEMLDTKEFLDSLKRVGR